MKKKARPRKVVESDLVLKELKALVYDPRGKFKPNWGRPYIIKKLLSRGADFLIDLDGVKFKQPDNIDSLNKYYA